LANTYAFITLRLWLAMRALVTGIEKFAGVKVTETELLDEFGDPDISGAMVEVKSKAYGLSDYHGIPESLVGKFEAEPLIPNFLLAPYGLLLGPVLLITGLLLLLGVATRTTLFVMGLMYTSLTLGLILIRQDGGVAWLAIHIILIVLALRLVPHNRFALSNKW
jgi:thiosulfate dehydrogenase [quinone] large subunit